MYNVTTPFLISSRFASKPSIYCIVVTFKLAVQSVYTFTSLMKAFRNVNSAFNYVGEGT